MTAVLQNETESANSVAVEPLRLWIIVSQVKSNRVVYFTDDEDYQPPTEGDWYYCSTYGGHLPKGMTLRNCWGWHFNGGVFADARENPKKSGKELLIDSNRKALLRILNEKIDAVRAPFQPDCMQGAAIRQQKWHEAQQLLALEPPPGDENAQASLRLPLLNAVATARNISLLEAAKLVTAKAQEAQEVLQESERFREQFKQAIQSAKSETQLLELREWLLDKIYPALTEQFKYQLQNTEPLNLDKPIKDTHRLHEVTRLKAQLREAINKKRAPIHSDYIQNDEVRKHKAKLAQALLSNQGNPVEGLDLSLLHTYAQARSLSLGNAAHLVLNSVASAGQLLVQTEQIKDTMLARIDAVRTLRDIRQVSAALGEL